MRKNRKTARGAVKKIVVLAASLTIVLGVSATAYATNLFGLNKLLIKAPVTEPATKETFIAKSPSPDLNKEAEKEQDLVYVQGWADSPEAKAAGEWNEFYQNYDQDGEILSKVGNDETKFDKKYGMYSVYSQEMADKVDEITKKYDLYLHKSMTMVSSNKELIKKIGADFLGKANQVEGGYVYEDGSFQYDGYAALEKGVKIDYQFGNTKKGCFSTVVLSIGDSKDYEQWVYKTADGTKVLLAMSGDKSLIVTERDKSFVSVNVLAGTKEGFLSEDGKINKEQLEQLADSFTYSVLK